LVAKATGYAAEVKVHQDDSCGNTSTLIVKAGGNPKTIWTERPMPQEQLDGNGINLVDWSPNGKSLLAESWRWTQAPNDAGVDKTILLFTADRWTMSEIDTALFLADQKDRSCWLEFKLLGFTPDGQVAMHIDITQFYEVDEQQLSDIPPGKRCTEKHETWAISQATQHPIPLPNYFRPKRYSETVGSPRSTTLNRFSSDTAARR
jgi:hypothetical protein